MTAGEPLSIQISEREWVEPERQFHAIGSEPSVFFLDSSMRGYGDARWSYLAVDPLLELMLLPDTATVLNRGEAESSPVSDWRQVLDEWLSRGPGEAPRGAPPFAGGWMGWFSWEMGCLWHGLDVRVADNGPLGILRFYDAVDCFDMGERRRWRVELGDQPSQILEKADASATPVPPPGLPLRVRAALSRTQYLKAVTAAQEQMRDSQIHLLSLSQQYHSDDAYLPAESYLRFRSACPSPYGVFVSDESGGSCLSSAELLMYYERFERTLLTRPIYASRLRRPTHDEDVRMARALVDGGAFLHSAERVAAEMTRRLEGVCIHNSLSVFEGCRREILPTEINLLSTLEAVLEPGKGPIDALATLSPPLSASGIPLQQAFSLQKTLEPAGRGLCGGMAGYLSLGGEARFVRTTNHLRCAASHTTFCTEALVGPDSEPLEVYSDITGKSQFAAEALTGHKVKTTRRRL